MHNNSKFLNYLLGCFAFCLCIAIMIAIGCASGGGTEGTWGRSYSGIVIADTGAPLSGVEVEMLETGVTAETNQNGAFTLPTVELGVMPVTLKLSGQGVNTEVTVNTALPEDNAVIHVTIAIDEAGNAEVTETDVQLDAAGEPTPSTNTPNTPTGNQPTAQPTNAPKAKTPTPHRTATPLPPGFTPVGGTPTPTSTPIPPQSTATPTSLPLPPLPSPSPTPTDDDCPGDFNGDGNIGLSDLAYVLSIFGTHQGEPGFDPDADFNDNGEIDQPDVDFIQSIFGSSC